MSDIAQTPVAVNAPVETHSRSRLQRTLTTRGVTRLALAGCLVLAELLPVGIGYGLWPSVDMGRVLALATGLNLVLVLMYALIGAITPRSGADYVFTSRVLPAPLAFAGSLSLVVAVVVVVGALAVLVAQSTLAPFILYTGTLLENATLASYATIFAEPQGAIITGTVMIVLAFLISVASPKANGRFLLVSVILALAGWGAILFQLLTADAATFSYRWNLVVGEGSYAGQISAARALSLMFSDPPGVLILAGIPLGVLVFLGARLPLLNSGEIKGSTGKAQLLGGGLAVLICAVLAYGSILLVGRAIPLDWLAAESHLFLYNNQLETPALPWLPFYAMLLRPIYPLYVLSTLGILAAFLAALQGFLRSVGRVLAAWSDDHLLTELVGYLQPGSQTPLFAILAVAMLAEIGVSLAANVGVMKTLNSATFALVCLQVLPALALILYPLMRRRWARAASPRGQKGFAVLFILSGLLVLVYVGWVVVTTFFYPATGSAISWVELAVLGGGLVFGVVWYFYRMITMRRRGIDLARRFTIFPEE